MRFQKKVATGIGWRGGRQNWCSASKSERRSDREIERESARMRESEEGMQHNATVRNGVVVYVLYIDERANGQTRWSMRTTNKDRTVEVRARGMACVYVE